CDPDDVPVLRRRRRRTTMKRYWRLLGVQLRMSLQLALQYRVDFLVGGSMALFWLLWNLLPMYVLWHARPVIAGWTFPEALLVAAWFTLLRGLLEGAVQPSLIAVVEHIRKGTLDFVLLKPADAQFLVSTARFEPWRATNVLTAAVIFSYAFHLLGRLPSPAGLLAAALLLFTATLLLYLLWLLTVSA